MGDTRRPPPLEIRDYSLTSLATGLTALNVRELRERVQSAPTASLVHHFWGRLLRVGEQRGEFGNDLAEWAAASLHDRVLAERLALVDPARSEAVEDLRTRILEVLDERLEELQGRPVEAVPEEPFHFVSDQMVVYRTGLRVEEPHALLQALDELSDESLFLHFVHPPGLESVRDLSAETWMEAFGGPARDAARDLRELDVFLIGHGELRARVRGVLEAHLENGG